MAKKIKVRILKQIDEKKKDAVSKKISYLMDKEGKPQDQAVAIALSMQDRGELEEEWSKSERNKRKSKCDNPKGFTMKQFCKNQRTKSKKGEKKNEEMELEERCQKGYKTHPTRKTKEMFGQTYRNCVKAEEGKDPKVGTGKKPEGSGRRLYTDENPKDTVSIKYATVADAKKTIAKVKRIKKPYARKIQILTVAEQRAKVMGKTAIAKLFKQAKAELRRKHNAVSNKQYPSL